MHPTLEQAIAGTRAWVDRIVIDLNLCPFARAVQSRGQVRYVATEVTDPDALLGVLCDELTTLALAPPEETATTVLIHPRVLEEFEAFNDFLDAADAAVRAMGLEGVLQVASFHPHYQFEDAGPDDIENYTNRSPYPMLHLLREASVERAVTSHPDTTTIYKKNIDTLRRLGHDGWRRLWLDE